MMNYYTFMTAFSVFAKNSEEMKKMGVKSLSVLDRLIFFVARFRFLRKTRRK